MRAARQSAKKVHAEKLHRSVKQVRAKRARNFLLHGPISVHDLNEIISAYNDCFEGTLAHTLRPVDDSHSSHAISSLGTLNDGTLLCGSFSKTVHMDPMAVSMERCRTLTNNESSMSAMSLLPDGKFALGFRGGEVCVWEDDVCVRKLTAHDNCWVTALAVLPDGKLASSSRNDTVCVWKDGERLLTMAGHTHWVMALAALPDGKLASGSLDTTVRVWDTTTGACLSTLRGHDSNVHALAMLSDGKLVSGSWDRTVRVWDLASGTSSLTLLGHNDGITCLAVLPDGNLVSGS